MSKKIELGKEYRFAGYDWIAVLCDDSNGVILQSLGITSGPWPGYKMEEYGNSQYYSSDISSINDYDEKTRKLYERIKGVEKKYSSREEGLYFPAGYVAGTNKVWRKALVTLAERAMDYVWLGTVRGKAALYISPCAGADYYLKSYCNQEKSCVIAPAFNLDLSKVEVVGDEIIIKDICNANQRKITTDKQKSTAKIEKQRENARKLNELVCHLAKLLESDDKRYSFEFAAGGTMEIFDKIDKIGYAVHIEPIEYDADGNATNL